MCMPPYPGPLRSTFLNLKVSKIYHIIDSSHCCIKYLYNLCPSLIFIKCESAHICTCALHVCHVNTPGFQKRDGSLATGITGVVSCPVQGLETEHELSVRATGARNCCAISLACLCVFLNIKSPFFLVCFPRVCQMFQLLKFSFLLYIFAIFFLFIVRCPGSGVASSCELPCACVLGTESGSSVRVVSALNRQGISALNRQASSLALH